MIPFFHIFRKITLFIEEFMQTILITGCSSGIGLCAAETLHNRGYRVFATVRKQNDAEPLKAKGIETIIMDVDNSESIQHGLNEVLAKTGGTLDALFNNSGFAIPGAVEDLTRDMMRAQFETNVFGAIELTNLVIPIMRKQGHGRIMMNTSMLGIVAFPFRGAYSASKFALEGFSSALRQELHGTPIFVSIIAPGPIKTHFRNNALKSYHETLKDKPSIHSDTYKKLTHNFNQPISKGEASVTLNPDAVVKKLIHALESKKPKARYIITVPAHVFIFLRRILSDRALDWVTARLLKAEISEGKKS